MHESAGRALSGSTRYDRARRDKCTVIDDDDANFVALATSGSGTWWGALIGLILTIAFSYVACQNREECEHRSCPEGQKPKLMKHECICVTSAK